MSCTYSGSTQPSEVNLVDQILEQGQRLRNAMVESIIKNDPYFNEFCSTQPNDDSCPKTKPLTVADKHKFLAYLKGDEMNQEEEREALETFRAMSNSDLCEVTEKSYAYMQNHCKCDTCRTYYRQNFDEICNNPVPLLNLRDTSRSELIITSEIESYFKCVDCMKITVHSLTLNDDGNMKVVSNFNDKLSKDYQQLQVMYFIEYDVPSKLVKSFTKKAKVNTGLDSVNSVKLCSKKLHKNAIYFKQTSMHDIVNLGSVDVNMIEIVFQVSCRCAKQQRANVIGFAKFELQTFIKTAYFNSTQELVVYLNKDSPIQLGTLKVNVQLGCGRLYFGKEFIESLSTDKRNINVSEISDESDRPVIVNKLEPRKKLVKAVRKVENAVDDEPHVVVDLVKPKPKPIQESKTEVPTVHKELEKSFDEKIILFGFIYIAEVEFLETKTQTYFTCQPFAQHDTLYSSVVSGGDKPFFNFCRIIPIIYEDSLVISLRDNFIVFEFWEKINHKDNLIGISKISLHQYYLAFRNPTIVKYLNRNQQPVIGTDWYEPITDPITGQLQGQVQILIALGSEQQIDNLQKERGFKDYVVTKAKRIILQKPSPVKEAKKLQKTINTQTLACKSDKSTLKIDTIDKGTQSDSSMDFKPETSNIGTNTERSNSQTMSLQSDNNADDGKGGVNNMHVRKTSDLLDSLQKTLNLNLSAPRDIFKAHVVVHSALHLPSRKKCKSKKSKGKREEILPSSYVSFETGNENEVKITQVVQKSTNPKWDFRCDVCLSNALLYNNQKRLIFKIWRKGNNAFLQPNMQIDTVLGFAALDLTVLAAGLPTVQGWFNIMDFSNKCNGQINISIAPLETIKKSIPIRTSSMQSDSTPPVINDEPGEVLSRTLKRKFIELDEISQRLRSRLSNVTNDESDVSNDEGADEFELAINTKCAEDDSDMSDFFTREAQHVNLQMVSKNLLEWQSAQSQSMSSDSIDINSPNTRTIFEETAAKFRRNDIDDVSSIESSDTMHHHLDRELIEGRQRIDALLEKLSLINNKSDDACNNRWVAGGTQQQNAESIMEELGITRQFDATELFDTRLQTHLEEEQNDNENVLEKQRDEPDGQGNVTDGKT